MNIAELAQKEGAYQPIIIEGKLESEGWRDCENRWKIVKPHIKDGSMVMDIGSHYGYFSMKVASELEDTFVWSMEADPKRADIQRRVLEANQLENIALSQYEFTLLDALKLERSCTMIDTVMLLSVAHYFVPYELPLISDTLSRIAPRLIIEFPSKEEVKVAERQRIVESDIEHLLYWCYDKVTKIGEAPSPSHPNINRSILLCENQTIKRTNCKSHIKAQHSNKHELNYKDKWYLDGKPTKYNGVCLSDLNLFNPIYPVDLEEKAIDAYQLCLKNREGSVTDISTSNIMVSTNGLRVIDYEEGIGKPIYGKSWEEYLEWVRNLDREGIREELRK